MSHLRRAALAHSLCTRIVDDRRSLDELRVLDLLLARIEKGADTYGPLLLASDPRDFKRERSEELLDLAVYAEIIRLAARGDDADDVALAELRDTGPIPLFAFDMTETD